MRRRPCLSAPRARCRALGLRALALGGALVWALAPARASAGPPVVDVGPVVDLGLTGANWVRVFPLDPAAGTWRVFFTGGRNYQAGVLTQSTMALARSPGVIIDRDDLIDHAITRCPDGSFLHVASGNLTEARDDSAWIFRYDGDDLSLIGENTIAEADLTYVYNDSPVLCDRRRVGTFVHPRGDEGAPMGAFHWVDEDLAVQESAAVLPGPPLPGSSVLWDAERSRYVSWRAYGDTGEFWVLEFDPDFALVGEHWLKPYPSGVKVGWPQGLARHGALWFVLHLAEREGVRYPSDSGDIWLSIFDADFALVQSVPITAYESGSTGGHRPAMARMGDQLMVTFDTELVPRAAALTLDLSVVGDELVEHGAPGFHGAAPADTGSPGDTATPAGDPGDGGTGEGGTGDTAPAVLDAGPDRRIAVGEAVMLDGESSLDCAWTVVSGPGGGRFADPAAARTAFTPAAAGTHTLALSAAGASDTVTVEATAAAAAKDGGCATGGRAGGGGLALLLLAGLGLAGRRRR